MFYCWKTSWNLNLIIDMCRLYAFKGKHSIAAELYKANFSTKVILLLMFLRNYQMMSTDQSCDLTFMSMDLNQCNFQMQNSITWRINLRKKYHQFALYLHFIAELLIHLTDLGSEYWGRFYSMINGVEWYLTEMVWHSDAEKF